MAGTIYEKVVDGEAFEHDTSEALKIACCDCNLTHLFEFTGPRGGKLGKIRITVHVDGRATAALRRGRRKKKE